MQDQQKENNNINVAPLVGAWIEITLSRRESNFVMSLLSWERGLKCCAKSVMTHKTASLLSWERGLKL